MTALKTHESEVDTMLGTTGQIDESKVRRLFGVPIHALRMTDVLEMVDEAIARRRSLLIGVVNAAKLVNMCRNPELGAAVRRSDLILADGMAVVWACRLLGRRLPRRIPGIDLMHHMLEHGRHRGHRFYCLGATQWVVDKAVAQMRQLHPGVEIVGSRNGYFSEAEEPMVAADIKAARPDVLFVAITSPKKERFMARWSQEMGVPVCHGVGGSFDVLAGKVKRAPWLWQRVGLEWLYRVIQEPRRMLRRYAETNTLFCWMMLGELWQRWTGKGR